MPFGFWLTRVKSKCQKLSLIHLKRFPQKNLLIMNWKLIFQLSLFGLAMAIATVFWIPSTIEPAFWLVIFIFCAYTIAKRTHGQYFLHGFMVSIINSVWITAAHFILYDKYVPNHPEEMEMFSKLGTSVDPRMMMLLMGPLFGVVFGLILGLFSFVAGKLVKKPAAPQA